MLKGRHNRYRHITKIAAPVKVALQTYEKRKQGKRLQSERFTRNSGPSVTKEQMWPGVRTPGRGKPGRERSRRA